MDGMHVITFPDPSDEIIADPKITMSCQLPIEPTFH